MRRDGIRFSLKHDASPSPEGCREDVCGGQPGRWRHTGSFLTPLVDGVRTALPLRQLPLLVHVGAPHQLHAQAETLGARQPQSVDQQRPGLLGTRTGEHTRRRENMLSPIDSGIQSNKGRSVCLEATEEVGHFTFIQTGEFDWLKEADSDKGQRSSNI
ncbi:hypothetical protein EYF80_052462 [Liparis tanakae]|uniref:Uncharacterized protein n=1 Tax=Liparis tanakae TaxID=230148 RepID=A0A4Z2F8A6_9TELE|nr:hypothetical protein EYF80_052462 [Liparis tanakae]